MELFILKLIGLTPVVLFLAYIVSQFKEKEEELIMQRISWMEYEAARQAALVTGAFLFTLSCIVLMLL